MRAVIYARYSTDLQRDASIEDQVRICTNRIATEGWRLVGTYKDSAQSGASRLRAGYQQMLMDAREHGFDVVVAEALDRLSRDQEDVAALYKQLTFAGVKLVTLAEGEISELHVGLKGTMNALFLKDLAAKTWRGIEGRVRNGKSGGGLCYGYDVVREHDARGEPVRGGRTIDENEAVIVRRIFAEFAAGKSPRAIAHALNADKVAGPGGRPWSDTTIRGHAIRRTGILHNEAYAGRLIWNKQRYVKDPATGRRIARVNPESKWIVQEIPELRIVDDALWQQVQDRLESIRGSDRVQKMRDTQFWVKRRARHLLSGLAHCGECGSPLAPVGKDYLACSAARRQGTCTNRASIRRHLLERPIIEALKENLMEPEPVAAFIREFHAHLNRQAHAIELGNAAKERELADVRRKLDGLITAIADGLRSPGLQTKLQELEQRKAILEREQAAAQPAPPRLHPNLAEVYRARVAELHAAFDDPKTHAEAVDLLRDLIERVDVRPAEDGFSIALTGAIVNMVKLFPGAESAGKEPYASSVKVVAGIGFEPMTFRL